MSSGNQTGFNTGFNQNTVNQNRTPGFNPNPYQPQYQFYGNQQYDMQMPWMDQFKQQTATRPVSTQTGMPSTPQLSPSYQSPQTQIAGTQPSTIDPWYQQALQNNVPAPAGKMVVDPITKRLTIAY